MGRYMALYLCIQLLLKISLQSAFANGKSTTATEAVHSFSHMNETSAIVLSGTYFQISVHRIKV